MMMMMMHLPEWQAPLVLMMPTHPDSGFECCVCWWKKQRDDARADQRAYWSFFVERRHVTTTTRWRMEREGGPLLQLLLLPRAFLLEQQNATWYYCYYLVDGEMLRSEIIVLWLVLSVISQSVISGASRTSSPHCHFFGSFFHFSLLNNFQLSNVFQI